LSLPIARSEKISDRAPVSPF